MAKENRPNVTLCPIQQAPNLKILKDRFGVSEEDVIISYGDKIYCPKVGMSRDLLIHEMVHCKRQSFNERSAAQWWSRYLEDPDFRLAEEAMAFREQFLFCKAVYKDRNAQARILHALATELCSERYGKCCDYSNALVLIQGKSMV